MIPLHKILIESPYAEMESGSHLQWPERAAHSPAAHSGDSLSPLVQVVALAQAQGSLHPTTGLLQSPPLLPDMVIKQLQVLKSTINLVPGHILD